MCYEGHTILESFSDFLTTTTKQLKSLISDDLDDVVRLHAELAYSEIRDLLRKLLAS